MTIATTNNRGLTDPAALTHRVVTKFVPPDVAREIRDWFKSDSLALSDGANVTLWNDLVGGHYANVNTATVPSGIPPVFRTNVVNGNPVVRFDGAQSFMTSDYFNISYPDTIFLVGKQSSKSTLGIFIMGWGDDNQLMGCMSGSGYYQIGDAFVPPLFNDSTDHSGAFHSFRFESFGPDAKGYVDGTLTISSASIAVIGSYQHVYGCRPDTLQFLTGDIAEIVYYAGTVNPYSTSALPIPLNPSDLKLIENYFARRYALPHATAIVPGPEHVGGLRFWLKADAIAQSDGTEITSWVDSSSNGFNFPKATGTGPTFKTGIVNGLPVARFNGTGTVVHQNLIWQPPFTIFFVAKVTGSGGPVQYTNYLQNNILVAPAGFSIVSNGSTISDSIDHTGAFHVFTALFDGTAPYTAKGFVDGVQTCSGGTLMLGGMGPNLQMGATTCDIAEIVFFYKALSDVHRQEIEAYLKAKYATP